MLIRNTRPEDLDRALEIYAYARDFMAEHGNPHQWGDRGWPPRELIESDIESGKGKVCEHDGKVVAVFFYDYGYDLDPTYRVIEDGSWIEDSPYGVVHRIATDGSVKGAGAYCIEWAFAQSGHLRIDTHGDNYVMQNLVTKMGFEHRGTIYVEEDDYPRLAYEKVSCGWGRMDETMRRYHDTEWGEPVHDDKVMFEHLMMECLQCGLSWDLMMKKREIFRECFAGFDYDKVAAFGDADVTRIMETEGMIRSERKIRAVIKNAQAFVRVREEFGSFCDYVWDFCGGKTILYQGHEKGIRIPVSNGLSAALSKDLKKRGFSYVGPVTIYSHLQACGVINDHKETCFCYKRINVNHPTVKKRRFKEVY